MSGVAYMLEGAALQVKTDRNVTIVGDGDGAIITRGQTNGRLIEVQGAWLELRNVRLENGRAQVRLRLRPRRQRLTPLRCAQTRKPPSGIRRVPLALQDGGGVFVQGPIATVIIRSCSIANCRATRVKHGYERSIRSSRQVELVLNTSQQG